MAEFGGEFVEGEKAGVEGVCGEFAGGDGG